MGVVVARPCGYLSHGSELRLPSVFGTSIGATIAHGAYGQDLDRGR